MEIAIYRYGDSFCLVSVGGTPTALVSRSVSVPTIGIGAGPDCDGQVLVWQDMLGMVDGLSPKFVKHYAELGAAMRQAFQTYADEVRAGTFPATEHTYGMDEKDLEKLY